MSLEKEDKLDNLNPYDDLASFGILEINEKDGNTEIFLKDGWEEKLESIKFDDQYGNNILHKFGEFFLGLKEESYMNEEINKKLNLDIKGFSDNTKIQVWQRLKIICGLADEQEQKKYVNFILEKGSKYRPIFLRDFKYSFSKNGNILKNIIVDKISDFEEDVWKQVINYDPKNIGKKAKEYKDLLVFQYTLQNNTTIDKTNKNTYFFALQDFWRDDNFPGIDQIKNFLKKESISYASFWEKLRIKITGENIPLGIDFFKDNGHLIDWETNKKGELKKGVSKELKSLQKLSKSNIRKYDFKEVNLGNFSYKQKLELKNYLIGEDSKGQERVGELSDYGRNEEENIIDTNIFLNKIGDKLPGLVETLGKDSELIVVLFLAIIQKWQSLLTIGGLGKKQSLSVNEINFIDKFIKNKNGQESINDIYWAMSQMGENIIEGMKNRLKFKKTIYNELGNGEGLGGGSGKGLGKFWDKESLNGYESEIFSQSNKANEILSNMSGKADFNFDNFGIGNEVPDDGEQPILIESIIPPTDESLYRGGVFKLDGTISSEVGNWENAKLENNISEVVHTMTIPVWKPNKQNVIPLPRNAKISKIEIETGFNSGVFENMNQNNFSLQYNPKTYIYRGKSQKKGIKVKVSFFEKKFENKEQKSADPMFLKMKDSKTISDFTPEKLGVYESMSVDEKATKIRDYFKTNFKYGFDNYAPSYQDGQDFVSYANDFINHSKDNNLGEIVMICNQSAGIYATLLQQNGIPSRVVSGLTTKSVDKDNKKVGFVSGPGHARVEYRNGNEWKQMDPTPYKAPSQEVQDILYSDPYELLNKMGGFSISDGKLLRNGKKIPEEKYLKENEYNTILKEEYKINGKVFKSNISNITEEIGEVYTIIPDNIESIDDVRKETFDKVSILKLSLETKNKRDDVKDLIEKSELSDTKNKTLLEYEKDFENLNKFYNQVDVIDYMDNDFKETDEIKEPNILKYTKITKENLLTARKKHKKIAEKIFYWYKTKFDKGSITSSEIDKLREMQVFLNFNFGTDNNYDIEKKETSDFGEYIKQKYINVPKVVLETVAEKFKDKKIKKSRNNDFLWDSNLRKYEVGDIQKEGKEFGSFYEFLNFLEIDMPLDIDIDIDSLESIKYETVFSGNDKAFMYIWGVLGYIEFKGSNFKNEGITELDLGRNQISSIPKEIGNLTNLETLDLGRNQISSIPKEIGNLTSLKELDLGNNGLEEFPKEVLNIPNLEILDLGRNQISSIPKEIGDLTKLKKLNLWKNGLEEFPKEVLNIPNLEKLYLGSNQIKEVPEEIGNLTKLKTLDLYNNGLEEIPKEVLNIPNLEFLSLGENQIKEVPKEIKKLTKLKGLFLNKNGLEEIPREVLDIPYLEVLNLGSNQIKKFPKEIKKLTSLKELILYNNGLEEIPKEVLNISNLEILHLGSNQIKEVPKEIKKLTSLKELILWGNTITSGETIKLNKNTVLEYRAYSWTKVDDGDGTVTYTKK